jgi:hypothetical protein
MRVGTGNAASILGAGCRLGRAHHAEARGTLIRVFPSCFGFGGATRLYRGRVKLSALHKGE